MEIWETISGKPGYMVSSEGRVASPRGVLTQERCKDGYRRVTTGHISSAAKKVRKSAGGFRWEYINSVEEFAE